jgi:hypothetical protein
VGDATTINAANFSRAQTSPDAITEMAVLAEEIYFFKGIATEIWDFSGALTAPFALSQGRTYARGCPAQDSVLKADNSLFWIGDDFRIYRTGSVPQDITTPYIADRLRACGDNIALCTALTNPGLYVAQTAAGQGADIFLGSSLDGTVYRLDPTSHTDDGKNIQVIVSAAQWVGGGVQRCNNISIHCVRGVGTPTTPNPVVQMRFSDDAGDTWSSWLQASLGQAGRSKFKARWGPCGLIQQPGKLFEFACSDSVNFTLEGASINEARV